ncbi:MAG: hypothetical protein A3K19_28705 [Lentisphaerae bacterium RIFOXYB12_FULL_65_16]|nr:MAG: hypothetical protein A3K18_31075 [Lentisphaerae bacterium RIFOXYA12_64_32]OGV92684.1 MAG: hypothetical protein A3K19_28705 [Lentisphaerae bacterium RIFOXYB12_FULL_65_16]
MNTKSSHLAEQYLAALRTHLKQGSRGSLAPADKLGRQAMGMGLETLDVAQIHEQAFTVLMAPTHPPGNGNGAIQRAGSFLIETLTPLAAACSAARQANVQPQPPNTTTPPRATELAALRQHLHRETVRRKTAETALARTRQHYKQVLAQSRLMQTQLRHLSHRILLAQEKERRQISHELHDEISQILTGINVRLAALKMEATANTGGLKRRIVSAQRLVERSVATVHRFARELRPAMLDDLGLIPTLLSFIKDLGKRTGLHIRFNAVTAGKIEKLDSLKLTVLYRVAQEALTNVAKHAQASQVSVSIQTPPGFICLEVWDNGTSFDVTDVLGPRRRKRLGILGMRERAEMVGGTFAIESAPGNGTTVRVQLPFRSDAKKLGLAVTPDEAIGRSGIL